MTGLATTPREERLISRFGSVTRGLLERDDLLRMLDRGVSNRVIVISAPPGSGKKSLLRVWADRSSNLRRISFVSVDRDEQNAQRFWSTVLDAIRDPERSTDPETQPAATAALDSDEIFDRVLSELVEQVEPVVLIIDDLHELRSAEAVAQLERLLAGDARARQLDAVEERLSATLVDAGGAASALVHTRSSLYQHGMRFDDQG
jgi:ATP/maltotriose-dependent transcriptional regulator MalT